MKKLLFCFMFLLLASPAWAFFAGATSERSTCKEAANPAYHDFDDIVVTITLPDKKAQAQPQYPDELRTENFIKSIGAQVNESFAPCLKGLIRNKTISIVNYDGQTNLPRAIYDEDTLVIFINVRYIKEKLPQHGDFFIFEKNILRNSMSAKEMISSRGYSWAAVLFPGEDFKKRLEDLIAGLEPVKLKFMK